MGLEKVKQEILENARKEVEAIVEAANSEAKGVVKAAEARIREYEKRVEEDAGRSVGAMVKRELASAELEAQKRLLAVKNDAIEGVFAHARRRLAQLGERKREAHVKSLLHRAGKELDIAVVRCNSRDTALAGSLVNARIVNDDKMLGGVVVESQDGRLRADYSYDAILGQVKAKVLGDVARTLFGSR